MRTNISLRFSDLAKNHLNFFPQFIYLSIQTNHSNSHYIFTTRK